MSEPRKRVFGPLLYCTLVACVLAALFAGIELGGPWVVRWLHRREIVRSLHDADAAVRLRNLKALENEGPAAYRSEVVEALGDPAVEVRLAACRMLAARGWEQPRLLPVLASAANDEQDTTRLEVAGILYLVQARAAPDLAKDGEAILLPMLKDRAGDVRAAAAMALGISPLSEAVNDALLAAVDDGDEAVRLAAIGSLLRRGGIEDSKAAEVLAAMAAGPEAAADRQTVIRLIQSARPEVRRRAREALLRLLASDDPLVVRDAMGSVGADYLPIETTRPALVKLLDHPDRRVRADAAVMLASNDDKPDARLLAALVRVVADRDIMQEQRFAAFGRLGEVAPAMLAGATPDLIVQLSDPVASVRLNALELLSQIVQDWPAVLPGGSKTK